VVALSTFDFVKRSREGYGPTSRTAADLCKRFRLRPDAKILLVSVATDRKLEAYWSYRSLYNAPIALALLGPVGITVPNFSFFNDAPRPHTLWNRRRMEVVARELSLAGARVIPHLNAATEADWQFWTSMLRERTDIRVIAKEFQTGNAPPERAVAAIQRLARLQRDLKRLLHPLLVGAARLAPLERRSG